MTTIILRRYPPLLDARLIFNCFIARCFCDHVNFEGGYAILFRTLYESRRSPRKPDEMNENADASSVSLDHDDLGRDRLSTGITDDDAVVIRSECTRWHGSYLYTRPCVCSNTNALPTAVSVTCVGAHPTL